MGLFQGVWRRVCGGTAGLMAAWLVLNASVAFAAPAAPVRIVQQETLEERFTVWLPQVEGMPDPVAQREFNESMARDMNEGRNVFRRAWEELKTMDQIPEGIKKSAHFWGTYAVKFNGDGLLSLTIRYYYMAGGAHGSTAMRAYNLDVATGKRMNLNDLFRTDTNYRERLNEWIREDIRRRGKAHYRFDGIRDSQEFYLTGEGLVIFYQPYDIASWADGYVRFLIPYDQLRDMLRPELPLY